MRAIAHIDCDCFYVSCERLRSAGLRGRPVGVLGNQGACVIARSYEMKDFGVKVGMPVWEAKKLCPEGVYVKRDFAWYDVLSKKMQKIFRSLSDNVEYYSIDESFIDFGKVGDLEDNMGNKFLDPRKLCKKLEQRAREIRERILEETGLPATVGLAMNRTVAKMAAKKAKPFGAIAVTESNLKEILGKTGIGVVSGIGRRILKKLDSLGIKTAFDYAHKPREFIKKFFHKPGEELWYELNGKFILPIRNERRQRKMLSRGGSIWGKHKDKDYVWGFLVRNLERLVSSAWKYRIVGNQFGLTLRTTEGIKFHEVTMLEDSTNDYGALMEVLQELFEKLFTPGFYYTRVHLYLLSLRSENPRQLNLFDDHDQRKEAERIRLAKEDLFRRFGQFAVRSGATGFVPAVFKDRTSDIEICDLEGKHCF